MNPILTIILIISIIFNIVLLEILKRTIKLLTESEINLNKALEKKINQNNNQDKISIKELSKENLTIKKEEPKIIKKDEKKELEQKPIEKKEIIKIESTKPKITNQNKVTSPINIPKEIPLVSLDLDNYINKKDNHNPKNDDYLKELSKELSKNIDKKIIPLTDYEQEEEKNAVISYKELINNNKDDTDKFIDDLKEFRNRLK